MQRNFHIRTRLSFHHFLKMEQPFAEMSRVLKPGGKLVIIDMEAAGERLREIEDRIETMRDCSHVKNRSRSEFLELFQEYGYYSLSNEIQTRRKGLNWRASSFSSLGIEPLCCGSRP